MSAASKPMPPSARRTPTTTATSAIPSVAASSRIEPGEERDAKRPHRRPAVLVAHRFDARTLRARAVERAQRRQPAHDVEEVVREQRQRLPALARAPLRVTADEPHEHRDEGQREEHHPGRERGRSTRRARAPRRARRRQARPEVGSGRRSSRARRRPRPPRSRPPRSVHRRARSASRRSRVSTTSSRSCEITSPAARLPATSNPHARERPSCHDHRRAARAASRPRRVTRLRTSAPPRVQGAPPARGRAAP